MCDLSTTCTNDESYQIVVRNVDTGIETCEYYCRAHLVHRIWELERHDSLAAVDATQLRG